MKGKTLKFLEIIYQVFNDNLFSFTEYITNFKEILDIDIKELLGIYSSLLERGYIKVVGPDYVYLTDKAFYNLNPVR